MRKMGKLFSTQLLAGLLFVLCMGGIVSCSDNEDAPDGSNLKKEFVGQWYYSEDNQIYCLSFFEDGTGEVTYYTYSEKQWNEQNLSLQYTLSDDVLTLKPTGKDVFVLEIGIVGNSMSFTNDDLAIMLTRYNGNKEIIEELKKEIEDNWLEQEPTESIDEDTFFQTEENVIMAISAIYSNLRNYEYKQMLLEKIRLTQKDFYDRPAASITPNSNEVSNAWQAAYKTVNSANVVINILESNDNISIDDQKRIAYINEAKVLRCMVYYNLAQLWNNIPYITAYNPDNIYEILQSPILSAHNIYNELNNTLQSIETLPEGENRVTIETVKALRGEIALSLGNNEEAKSLLDNCHSDFSILVDGSSTPDMYQIFGDKIPNYTSEKVELLLQEANVKDANKISSLVDAWKLKKQYWGYWVMLKRTKQAQVVCGCEDYELLMPIPQSELEMMPSLVQNPGY